MRAHQAHYPVATQCRLLDVSTSGYYAWQRRGMSARAEADRELLSMIQAIHASSHGTYGAPRIHAELGAQGVRVGRKRVARLMRSVALAGVSRRKRPHTTVRSRGTAKAPDLVQRQFTAEAPDRLWVADITYVPTRAGFLYLAVVVDVFSRRVVGWAMESHLRTELVLQALNMALYLRRPQGVIHHSDQGIQYTDYAFGKRCSEWGVRPSMGSVGDCYDNALCESFFASLECELLDRRSFQTHAEARMAVFQYIEGWYNTHRRHSSIGYYAPIAFERRYTSSIQHVEPLTVHQIGATPELRSNWARSFQRPIPHRSRRRNPRLSRHLSPRPCRHLSPRPCRHLSPRLSRHLSPRLSRHLSPRLSRHLSRRRSPRLSRRRNPRLSQGPNRHRVPLRGHPRLLIVQLEFHHHKAARQRTEQVHTMWALPYPQVLISNNSPLLAWQRQSLGACS